jgi:hypothetical protein
LRAVRIRVLIDVDCRGTTIRPFHTPLSVYDLANVEDMNRDLRERLCDEARTSPGMRRANVGGWHSPSDLALRADPCYRMVMKVIVRSRRRYAVEGRRRHGTCPIALARRR